MKFYYIHAYPCQYYHLVRTKKKLIQDINQQKNLLVLENIEPFKFT